MKITVILCFMICSVALHAQDNATLKGKITDHEMEDAPLAFALISLEEADITTESTLEGHYLIHGIAPGKYTITIAFPGYQTLRKPITITNQSLVELDVSMRALVLKHEEVLQAHDQ